MVPLSRDLQGLTTLAILTTVSTIRQLPSIQGERSAGTSTARWLPGALPRAVALIAFGQGKGKTANVG
jgi:hypothetical protein